MHTHCMHAHTYIHVHTHRNALYCASSNCGGWDLRVNLQVKLFELFPFSESAQFPIVHISKFFAGLLIGWNASFCVDFAEDFQSDRTKTKLQIPILCVCISVCVCVRVCSSSSSQRKSSCVGL